MRRYWTLQPATHEPKSCGSERGSSRFSVFLRSHSPEDPMTEEQLNAIEAALQDGATMPLNCALNLVAEVRRLRAGIEEAMHYLPRAGCSGCAAGVAQVDLQALLEQS